MYDQHILKKYRNELNKNVKEEGISNIIIEMNIEIEINEFREKIHKVEKNSGYDRIKSFLQLFITILENNIDIKINNIREILIGKLKNISNFFS